MQATPEGEKQSRAKEFKGTALTDVSPAEHSLGLLGLAQSCGLSSSNGMGITPTPWSEIDAWAQSHPCSIFERNALRKISESYVSGYQNGSDPEFTPALGEQVDYRTAKLQKAERQLRNMLMGLK